MYVGRYVYVYILTSTCTYTCCLLHRTVGYVLPLSTRTYSFDKQVTDWYKHPGKVNKRVPFCVVCVLHMGARVLVHR